MHSRTPREQALWLSCRERAKPPTEEPAAARAEPDRTGPAGGYRPWAELLARTFAVDVLRFPSCLGRMRLLAVIKEPVSWPDCLGYSHLEARPQRIPRVTSTSGSTIASGSHSGRLDTLDTGLDDGQEVRHSPGRHAIWGDRINGGVGVGRSASGSRVRSDELQHGGSCPSSGGASRHPLGTGCLRKGAS